MTQQKYTRNEQISLITEIGERRIRGTIYRWWVWEFFGCIGCHKNAPITRNLWLRGKRVGIRDQLSSCTRIDIQIFGILYLACSRFYCCFERRRDGAELQFTTGGQYKGWMCGLRTLRLPFGMQLHEFFFSTPAPPKEK